MNKSVKFSQHMRWKAFQYFGKLNISRKKNGFKTRKFLSCLEKLVDFKNNMINYLPLMNFFFENIV